MIRVEQFYAANDAKAPARGRIALGTFKVPCRVFGTDAFAYSNQSPVPSPPWTPRASTVAGGGTSISSEQLRVSLTSGNTIRCVFSRPDIAATCGDDVVSMEFISFVSGAVQQRRGFGVASYITIGTPGNFATASFYEFTTDNFSGNGSATSRLVLRKTVLGASSLGTSLAQTIQPNEVMSLRVVRLGNGNDELRGLVDGVEVMSLEITNGNLTDGPPGMGNQFCQSGLSATGPVWTFDNWRFSELGCIGI